MLLAIWLGLTFVSEVPSNRYPSLGKGSVSISAKDRKTPLSTAVNGGKEGGIATVNVAH